jgi:hypothetical protein
VDQVLRERRPTARTGHDEPAPYGDAPVYLFGWDGEAFVLRD